jgi:hypothetical protein
MIVRFLHCHVTLLRYHVTFLGLNELICREVHVTSILSFLRGIIWRVFIG